ncbi:MAG: UbiX family flavin prenyltransferase [Campylobacterales bacterium]|nr:UbiX family flavin prenyltransferase [Campylobacterales bacterium]NQY53743.1 UbiX family flavin prenyltransferase [Campylobacteraceae bacterium]
MKIVLGITGASGAVLALKFLEHLPLDVTAYVVISKSAKIALKYEASKNYKNIKNKKNIKIFKENDIAAPIASGSFKVDKMIILPCSMNTLAKCACGISDNLITRSFTVMLKEKREIILAPRELPFSSIALENMLKLSNLGVVIAPPMLAYYSNQESLEQMEDFIIGKWFDLLKIENNLYKRWKNNE